MVFLRLGLTSFGGPVAHLGFFHDEFVTRRQWVTEDEYADLVALCQFLPGPASSQVGMALGRHRGGIWGALAAWFAFTLPSALLMILFGLGVTVYSAALQSGWIHALKVVAVAVVAQAIWTMSVKLCPDRTRILVAAVAFLMTFFIPSAGAQIAAIALGGVLGLFLLKKDLQNSESPKKRPLLKIKPSFFLSAFFILLFCLPLAVHFFGNPSLQVFESFYRVGSLVFGGGHVVLPLLQTEVVASGQVSADIFMAGYGAAQALPGPLFTFSAYLGAVSATPPSGWWGALICLVAVFLPSFLLIMGVLPYWENLRKFPKMQQAMSGMNAAVVGLLISAFFDPVWRSGILSLQDFFLAVAALVLLAFFKAPSWSVVLMGAFVGGLF